jgi:transglutaminase/protease-like cytokinesis protein 3
LKDLQDGNVNKRIYIGELSYGMCRHKAMLFKYLCDFMGLKCRIVVGWYNDGETSDAHMWNVIVISELE